MSGRSLQMVRRSLAHFLGTTITANCSCPFVAPPAPYTQYALNKVLFPPASPILCETRSCWAVRCRHGGDSGASHEFGSRGAQVNFKSLSVYVSDPHKPAKVAPVCPSFQDEGPYNWYFGGLADLPCFCDVAREGAVP